VNLSGNFRNSTISVSSCFASSTPATSENVICGLSPLNNRARLRPNEIAWLFPDWVWRSIHHMKAPMMSRRKRLGRMMETSTLAELGCSTLSGTLSSSSLFSIW
jgi:hypothetical protein